MDAIVAQVVAEFGATFLLEILYGQIQDVHFTVVVDTGSRVRWRTFSEMLSYYYQVWRMYSSIGGVGH